MKVNEWSIVYAAILACFASAVLPGCERSEPDWALDAESEVQDTVDTSDEQESGLADYAYQKRKHDVIKKMQHELATARKTEAAVPPAEVRAKLTGAWRLDARLKEGTWVDWRQAGKSQDIEFRDDGTLQAYLGNDRMDGTYETSPGDGCVDILMTLGKSYTYAYSITFEDDRLVMTGWERTEFTKKRIVKSVEDGRQKGSLTRYYRVTGFQAEN